MNMSALALAFTLALCLSVSAIAAEGPWQRPVIKAAGDAVDLPDAAVQPALDLKYKIVFDVTKDKVQKGELVPGLAKVARLINVYALRGMPPQKMDLALVMHGPATEAILRPEAYQKKHGFANPNLTIIDQLAAAGVKLFVCGQALKEHSIAHDEVNPKIKVAVSALTVLPTYQLKGYAVLFF